MSAQTKRQATKSQKPNPAPRENYQEYERRKAELPADLTPEQYDQALQAIARRLGV